MSHEFITTLNEDLNNQESENAGPFELGGINQTSANEHQKIQTLNSQLNRREFLNLTAGIAFELALGANRSPRFGFGNELSELDVKNQEIGKNLYTNARGEIDPTILEFERKIKNGEIKQKTSFAGRPTYYGGNLWNQVLANGSFRRSQIAGTPYESWSNFQAVAAVNPARINTDYYNQMMALYNFGIKKGYGNKGLYNIINQDQTLRNLGNSIIGKPIVMRAQNGKLYPTLIADNMANRHSAMDLGLIANTEGAASNFVMDGNANFMSKAFEEQGVYFDKSGGFKIIGGNGAFIEPPSVEIYYFE